MDHPDPPTIQAYGMTDRGRVRPRNEDAFLVNLRHRLFAVADGLGGLPGGAEASQRVVELLEERLEHLPPSDCPLDLVHVIESINETLSKEGQDAHPITGSGSTLTLGQLAQDNFYLAHVGDSAAYHLRGEQLQRLTADHTMETEFINLHGESARALMPPEYPHTLTRCLGQGDELLVDQTRVNIAPGDRILLCTDGLDKVLNQALIGKELRYGDTPESIARSLTDLANAAEGSDNITVVCLFIDSINSQHE